eukprot:1152293-Rhodomonas_salina.1
MSHIACDVMSRDIMSRMISRHAISHHETCCRETWSPNRPVGGAGDDEDNILSLIMSGSMIPP